MIEAISGCAESGNVGMPVKMNPGNLKIDELDINQDGVLSLEELSKATGNDEFATKAFKQMDANQDGKVDKAEMTEMQERAQSKMLAFEESFQAKMQEQGIDPDKIPSIMDYISGKDTELDKEQKELLEKYMSNIKRKSPYSKNKAPGMLLNISA